MHHTECRSLESFIQYSKTLTQKTMTKESIEGIIIIQRQEQAIQPAEDSITVIPTHINDVR